MGIYPGNGPGQFDLPHSVDIDRNRRVCGRPRQQPHSSV